MGPIYHISFQEQEVTKLGEWRMTVFQWKKALKASY